MRVVAIIPIITHHEIRLSGHLEGFARFNALAEGSGGTGADVVGRFVDESFVSIGAVDVDLAVLNQDAIAGNPDNAFDERLIFAVARHFLEEFGWTEDHNVAGFWRLGPVGYFFNDESIVHFKCGQHRF